MLYTDSGQGVGGRLFSLLLFAAELQACALARPAMPEDLTGAARVPLDYTFWWQSGGRLDGLRMEDWHYLRQSGRTQWIGFRIVEEESQDTAWAVACSSGHVRKQSPPAWSVCTFRPGSDERPPMSLVLVARGDTDPMSGLFLREETFELTGSARLRDDLLYRLSNDRERPPTAGLVVGKDGKALGFVSMLADTIQEAWLDAAVEDRTRLALAPLFLSFGAVWDPREQRSSFFGKRKAAPNPSVQPSSPWTPHVEELAERPELQSALKVHVLHRPTELRFDPPPRLGPDLRPNRRRALTFDVGFLGLAFGAPLDDSPTGGPEEGWAFGYPIQLGTTLFDFIHFQNSVQFGAPRSDVGPLAQSLGLPGSQTSSNAVRVATGLRVTVARFGPFRPFVGGEAVFTWTSAGLEVGDADVQVQRWGIGGAPVVGLRIVGDAGKASVELISEARLDLLRLTGQEDRTPTGDPLTDFESALRMDARSVQGSGIMYVLFRL